MTIHLPHRGFPSHRASWAHRVVGELGNAGSELAAQSRRSSATLASASPWVLLIAALWVLGIVGDAMTTVVMMGTGRFEEANGFAGALMGVFGVRGWVVLSSLVCLGIASLSLARPRSVYAWTGASVALVVCAGKVWTASSNAMLWWSVSV